MSASSVLILFLIGMVIAIYVGNRFDAIGLIAIFFAYLIGVFGLGMKASAVIATFPTKTLFIIISICWLFGYANENGTLRAITLNLVYRFRKYPSILPWAFFLISGVICMTGASPFAPNAILMPIIISVCLATGISPLFGSLMVSLGAYIGSQVPWGQGASIQRGVLEASEHAAEAEIIIWNGYLASVIFALAAGIITFVIFKGWRAKVDETFIHEPEAMTSAQKKTFALILALVILMVVPSLLGLFGIAAMKKLSSKLDISLVCCTLAMIAAILKLANAKTVVSRHIPWNTIMLLAGVSMLVGVASEGGAVDLTGTWIGSNVPSALLVPAFVLLAAFMSVFVSGASVVTPTLFVLVPSIASTAAGVNYHALYAGIAVGANASAISPFSGGGSLTLANIKQDNIRERMFMPLIISALLLSLLAALLSVFGVYGII